MRAVRRVAMLIDREMSIEDDPAHISEEARQHAGMEFHLAAALRSMRYVVSVIPFRSGKQLIADLGRAAPDVVYNATEHVYGKRADDIQIPALLEMLRIPYTGATPAALLLCRDKAVSKSLAAMVDVRAPAFALAPVGEESPHDLPPFPVVIKPVASDASLGIDMTSVVRRRGALAHRLRVFHRRHGQTAIVESFIAGSDLYVFALQDRALRIMPAVELCIDADASSARSMATYHVKHDDAYRERWKIHCRPADLAGRSRREIERSIRRLWPVLQLRDYCRFDFRLAPTGEVYFIEANPNPGFSPGDRYDGWSDEDYAATVAVLIRNAAKRRR
jgi:D-alanine-D-alanine ligase